MIQKSKLSVSLHEVEFSKDFRYKIAIDFEKQKRETDISATVRNPIFVNSTHYFDLLSNHTLHGVIVFIAHMIIDENQSQSSQSGKVITKVLGESSLDLSTFALQPEQTYHLPIRQQLKFVRSKDSKEVIVGRFIASIKIVAEQNLPVYLNQLQQKKIEKNEYYAQLPDFDLTNSYKWRVRLEIREATNIPLTDGAQPRVLVETGWCEYQDSLPEQKRIIVSATVNSSHPQWHQTILIYNPPHMLEPKGFVMLIVRDSHNLEDIFKTYIPIGLMGNFIPYNLRLYKERQESLTPTQFYFSALLQHCPNQATYNIVVQDISFEPLAVPFKQMNLTLVSNSQNQPKIQFYSLNSKQDSIDRILQFDQADEFNYVLSQTMRIPPIKSGNYRAATVFTIPQSALRKQISIYLIGRPEKTVYRIAGLAQKIQSDLISLLIDKTKKKIFLAVRNQPGSKFGNCQIEISNPEIPTETNSREFQPGQQTASERLMKELNFSSNESMLRHVAQSNQIIARILRQLDDKSDSLRQAAAEISDLRGRVKLLQNENSILRQQALREEDELVSLVQREVENMGVRQLKEKIVKISQLYKAEKIRSRQLDKTIKLMEPQISNTMQLNSIIVTQKNSLQALKEKTERMSKEQDRIGVYKETIKKQEQVISKLEKVMREGMEEVRNARNTRLQLEQLKKGREGNNRGTSRGQNREEVERLQNIIAQLQEKGSSSVKEDTREDEGGRYEMQFKLHQAEMRIASLQEQLQEKSKSYARELATFRMKLAEKQAVMDGYRQ